MIRCCYFGLSNIYDAAVDSLFAQEFSGIIDQDDKIEFWFFRLCDALDLCLKYVDKIRSNHPEKKISIVKVVDPARQISQGDSSRTKYSYPNCVPDREQNPFNFVAKSGEKGNPITHGNRIERWMLEQCQYIFVYAYPELQLFTNSEKYIKKLDVKIIRLQLPETSEYIHEQINALDKRGYYIIESLNRGMSARKIGVS